MVPALFAVETYPTVHQMTSTVTAELAEDRDAVDVIAALFPCGSITGAPKLRAIAALDEIEADARGPYTGSIGRIDRDGDAQFNVAIRTLHWRDGEATLGLGGGIVADSTADAEWDEALAKGAFVAAAARPLDLIETMAFDPMEGVLRVERHLFSTYWRDDWGMLAWTREGPEAGRQELVAQLEPSTVTLP